MTPQSVNLLISIAIAWMALVLFVTAWVRDLPLRSLFAYGAITLMASVSVVGATGAWLIAEGSGEYSDVLSQIASILRAGGFILVASLIWYEHSHSYVRRHCRDCPHSGEPMVDSDLTD
jgi:hypothetical protein